MKQTDLREIRAVLFDLDGTLLQVEMGEFIPAYIDGLAQHFSDCTDRRTFNQVIRAATFALIQREDGLRCNDEHFFLATSHSLGIDGSLFSERIGRYCDDGLGDLKGMIQPLPLARRIVERCFQRGLRVVIATNPVFPRPVVEARLRWGGLGDLPFDLVTTFENSRFCKPNRRYFEDVLEQLGLTPSEAVMVGNDTEHDLGASRAGITTFLVDTWLVDRLDGRYSPDFQGGHQELYRFVNSLGSAAAESAEWTEED